MIAVKSSWWHMQCLESHLSNKAKACLIELVGDLPEDKHAMLYGKDCEPQEAMLQTVIDTNMTKLHSLLTDIYEPTRVTIMGSENTYIMLQKQDTLEKILVNSVFIDILDINDIDEEKGETQVNPAPYGTKDSNMLLYHNNVMDFVFYKHPIRYRKTEEIKDLLEAQDCAWNLMPEERIMD